MARTYFYDGPNPAAPPLGYPTDPAGRRVPDDWTVWATADIHGMSRSFAAVLREAGLTDAAGHWTAPPRTALVGVGDYVDRGPDSAGVVMMLRRLSAQAEERGGIVRLARGNHEQMVVDILRGDPEWQTSWLANGGEQFLASYDIPRSQSVANVADTVERRAPGTLDWLLATLPYVVWRDVLFVHAGLVPGGSLTTLGDSDQQLWTPRPFTETGLGDERFRGYGLDGVARVVLGHVPQDDGPTLLHDGATMLIDTNPCGLRGYGPTPLTARASVIRIPERGDLAKSHVVLVDATS